MEPSDTNNQKTTWDVLGHATIARYLHMSITEDKLSHAYLFYGPHHVGKWHLAKIFSQALVCTSKKGERPCNTCTHCIQIAGSGHPNVTLIERPEDKQVISIEQIRSLQHSLTMRSFDAQNRLVLIHEAERLTEEAGNALLKTLEEPPQHTTFIITAEHRRSVPQTIVSRCVPIHFSLVETASITQWLKDKGAAPQTARIIAHASLGRPGIARQLYDDPELLEKRKQSIELLSQIIRSSVSEKIYLVNAALQKIPRDAKQDEAQQMLNVWLTFFRDIILAKSSSNALANISYKETLRKLTEVYPQTRVVHAIDTISNVKKRLQQSINPTLLLENLALAL